MEEGEEEEFLSQSESTDEQQETASQPPDSEPPAAKKGRKTTKKTADAVSKKTVNQNPKKGTSDPCLCCGECCAKGQLAVKCVICSLWAHKTCLKMPDAVYKSLDQQFRDTGLGYWVCRPCQNFSQRVKFEFGEIKEKQVETDRRVDVHERRLNDHEKERDEMKEMMRQMSERLEREQERMERTLEEELRERESRRLNLVLHGVPEPRQDIKEPKDRMEADKEECERIFGGMRARTRKDQIRFCRRVGERGQDPRPMVIGLYSEGDKRHVLEKSRDLRNTMYESVSVVPDLTRSQRQGEKRLREEADRRNQELPAEDRDKNLKWIVVGSRGEKRIIKGTEREDYGGSTRGGGRGRGDTGGGYNTRGRGGYNPGTAGDRSDEERAIAGGNGQKSQNTAGGEMVYVETVQHNSGAPGGITAPLGLETTAPGGPSSAQPSYNNGQQGTHNSGYNNSGNNYNTRNGRGYNNIYNNSIGYGRGNNYGGNRGQYSSNNHGQNSNYSGGASGYNGGGGSGWSGNNNGPGNNNYNGGGWSSNNYGNGNGYNNGSNNNSNNNNSNNGNGYGHNRGYNNSNNGNGGRDGNGGGERPWQEVGARRKERQPAENGTNREQQGMARTDEEEIAWGTGPLPEPIGNKQRERLGSKRNRSWDEDEERDNRRPRS